MIGLQINAVDGASPKLEKFLSGLKQRRGLHQMMGNRVQALVRDHLIKLAGSRHATADRLGATPSGHLGKAAEKVASPASVRAGEDEAALVINHPGIGRAFHDVTIKPTKSKYLTIPLIAEAYNRRAYRVPDLFVLKGTPLLAKTDGDGKIKVWYRLVKSVRQKQDRTLLPSDEEIRQAALAGVGDYIDLLRGRN
jgi:hypothetical protein